VAPVRPTYRAIAERDGRWWAIRVVELPGVFSQARRLADVERMARDAIGLVQGVAPDSFDVLVEPSLEDTAGSLVDAARSSRSDAEVATRRASDDLRASVRRLTAAGLTVRDVAFVLGLSHQRVAQVAGRHRSRASR
jgi:predicted RNase H-like HicB family nuclease